jgi:hypothetical protein
MLITPCKYKVESFFDVLYLVCDDDFLIEMDTLDQHPHESRCVKVVQEHCSYHTGHLEMKKRTNF